MEHKNLIDALKKIEKLRADLLKEHEDVKVELKTQIGNYLKRIEELEEELKEIKDSSI